jgi:hypothetical protein
VFVGGPISLPIRLHRAGRPNRESGLRTRHLVDGFDTIVRNRVDRTIEPPAGDVTATDG